MLAAPISVNALRRAIEAVDPTTVLIRVVSAVSRDWISPFLDAQAAELNAAENTLLAYGRDLVHFDDWLARQGRDFSTASRADIEAYLVALDAEGFQDGTGEMHSRRLPIEPNQVPKRDSDLEGAALRLQP